MKTQRITRRGSIYVLALGVSLIVAVIGFAALLGARVELRRAAEGPAADEANLLAFSGVEHALLFIESNDGWRTLVLNDTWTPAVPLGEGVCRWKLVDKDGNLAEDEQDVLRVWGRGEVGATVQMLSVLYDPTSQPLEVLATAIHTSGTLTIEGPLTVNGGPASTNGVLERVGTLYGDAECSASLGSGTITGTLTEPAPLKPMPPASIFDQYVALATEIPFGTGTLEVPLLSAGVNPWGAGNPDGIYLVQVPTGGQLKVRIDRILGTLVILAEPNAQVKFSDPMLLEPFRAEHPALLIKSQSAVVQLLCQPNSISEASVGANLNPPGTPYGGESDSTLDDVYPSVLRGVIHIIGPSDTVAISAGLTVEGTVIVDGPVNVGAGTLTHDAGIYNDPPSAYDGARPGPDPTSWRREFEPPPP